VDTKHVSVGQCAVVAAVAAWLKDHPEATLDEAAAAAVAIGEQTKMTFIPDNLDYLRAGGRCSNAVALVGNLLQLHPCIEIIGGKLIAGKKYRGQLAKVAPALLKEFIAKHQLSMEHMYFIHTPYMKEEVRNALNAEAAALGIREVTWIKTGCVITCHGGPGAFGIVGTVTV
jgi:DegV family protein with EDD domain